MKNLKVKVVELCISNVWDFGIFEGRKMLMVVPIKVWYRKSAAIRNAKAMAVRLGIPFDDKIVKQHGC